MNHAQLEVKVNLINDKVQFSGEAGSNQPVTIDYVPPLGDGQGYTPLELQLMSLAACSGSTVVTLLRRMRKTITGLQVKATGVRRDQHPLSFQTITLEFLLHSPDAEDADVQKAIQMSEEIYCPVWAMLKGNVEVVAKYSIIIESQE